MELCWILGYLLLLAKTTLQLESSSYTGAVVEYYPVTHSINNEKPSHINADNYVKIIKKASDYSADILVFPESSLSTPTSMDPKISRSEAASYVPDPRDNLVPCDDKTYAYSLRTISCAARDHRMYVVVNHREKVDCLGNTTGCPSDNLLIYNTNVAFDRQGRVIARYRKFNLFGERGTNVTEDPVTSTFRTDFGVTFGQFICFDVLFSRPALNLTTQMGIRDIIFSSHWFSELPFLVSVQAQAGWAHANDVNLLSSGYNMPLTVSGGSGIFIGREGYSQVLLRTKPANVLMVSEIPMVIDGKRLVNINTEKSFTYEFDESEINTTTSAFSKSFVPLIEDLSIYTTKKIDLKSSVSDEILCDRELCCDFKFNVSFHKNMANDDARYYRYRMAVFNGTRTFRGVATGGIKSCGIISCTNNTLSSCGRLIDPSVRISSPTTFHSIEITMRNVSYENHFFMPAGISRDLLPLNVTDYTFETTDLLNGTSTRKMVLTKPRNDLLTFAIFGRNFAVDGSDVTKNASSKNIFKKTLFIIALIFMSCRYLNLWS
ncbi:vanin-like protein 2 [Copidosoma floridanum]|uniref:vanin-like protein 2 n=1 Tax=Copidosoma floridanum TaxID=29053 RepID=UPI000C6F73CD|nr:vanin-like protein 2 [Copidosoma floridanum]XP_023245627.1 vanin-like protein 2 [Copidosoma floridanum]